MHRSEKGQEAPHPDEPPHRPEEVVLRFELDPARAELVRKAFALLRAGAGDVPLDRSALLARMAERVIAEEAPAQRIRAERWDR